MGRNQSLVKIIRLLHILTVIFATLFSVEKFLTANAQNTEMLAEKGEELFVFILCQIILPWFFYRDKFIYQYSSKIYLLCAMLASTLTNPILLIFLPELINIYSVEIGHLAKMYTLFVIPMLFLSFGTSFIVWDVLTFISKRHQARNFGAQQRQMGPKRLIKSTVSLLFVLFYILLLFGAAAEL